MPSVAVLTMARDEGQMLRRWVDHYGNAVGRQNLLVFDDNSVDGSTAGLNCPVVPLPPLHGGREFERKRIVLINRFARGMLTVHDVVIFVDVDEFLIPDPAKHAGLREFLAARADVPVIAPMTLNVLHFVGVEPQFDPARPVLAQRSFAKFMPGMCKPSIKRVDVRWTVAGHGIAREYDVDPELFMLHLKFFDESHLAETVRKRESLVRMDGRAPHSNWNRGSEVVQALKQAVAGVDPTTVREFDPAAVNLGALVVNGRAPGIYRGRDQGQIRGMRQRPLVRVPRRLVGLL